MRTTTEIRGERGLIIPTYAMNQVWETTCDYFGVNPIAALGECRKREMVMCRHIAAFILRYEPYKMTWDDIGSFLGGRDHTTVMNSVRQVKGWLETELDLQYDISSIRELINSPATIEKIKTKYNGVVSF